MVKTVGFVGLGRLGVPGDVIRMGTPAEGGLSGGTFVEPRDVLRTAIDGLGTLTTPIVAPTAAGGSR